MYICVCCCTWQVVAIPSSMSRDVISDPDFGYVDD